MAGTELVLSEYRGAPQRRSGRTSDWTKKMADDFVEMLADTCNVTLAAKAIGRSVGNVYKWRAKDAAFRAAWDGALATGYARLEMMMLERALHGVEKTVVARDGTTIVMREYSDRVALTLLRMHRENAALAQSIDEDDDEYREACERIMERLERLKEREEKSEAGVAVGDDPSTTLRAVQQPQLDMPPACPDRLLPEQAQGGIVETKGARDVLALIAWGLGRGRGRA